MFSISSLFKNISFNSFLSFTQSSVGVLRFSPPLLAGDPRVALTEHRLPLYLALYTPAKFSSYANLRKDQGPITR